MHCVENALRLNCANPWSIKEKLMAKPNYTFEKRQKEIAKKKKKEEKLLKKAKAKDSQQQPEQPITGSDDVAPVGEA